MKRFITPLITLAALAQVATHSLAADALKPAELLDRAKKSLVVVQFTYEGELGKRDFAGMGVVVDDAGTIVYSLDLAPRGLPDSQMTHFKLMRPGDPENEIDAEFLGRDERYGLSYVKAKADKEKKTEWTPLTFVDKPVSIGEMVYSVGLLPKQAGYNAYFSSADVAAMLRGPVPQVLVTGSGLTVIGSPVFNEAGEVVGLVNSQPERTVLLNDPRNPFASVESPTRIFTPAGDFIASLKSPPKATEPLKLAFIGVTSLTGLTKDVAEFYGLKGKVAIQVGDVIPGFSADRAGLKKSDIIVSLNGKPLDRGDLPDEAPAIFTRELSKLDVGDKVTLGVVSERGAEPKPVEVTMDERPAQANRAARHYAEDLGFTTRDVVFEDTYARKIPAETKGGVITFVRPQSPAQAAGLAPNDFVQRINQTPVTGVEQFKTDYAAFRKEKPAEAVVLEVLRQGNTQIIRIEPPRE
jgi:S1-C subfamily serine protease